jgi:hypothetical protein
MDPAKAFAIEAPQRFSQAPTGRTTCPEGRSSRSYCEQDRHRGQVEHDGDRQCVVAPGQSTVSGGGHCGVDDGKPAPRQTLGGDGMDEVEKPLHSGRSRRRQRAHGIDRTR